MKAPNIRTAQKLFIDRQHFPYGFRKSGDFSIPEADSLAQYGRTLAALEAGELQPETEDEQHFIDVLKGQETAVNTVEKAWLKYIKLARGRKQFYTLHSKASNQADFDDDYTDDEFDVA
jgi:uncharacterized protein YifE (UPF0438 family)